MKKVLSAILFLSVLTIPFIGTYLWLSQQKTVIRKKIKHQIINGIDKNELVYFAFSKKDAQTKLKWEHSKEFEYKKEMYDVVEKIETGDSVRLWCWWDHEETRLNKMLSQLVINALADDPGQKKTKNKFNKFTKSLYCEKAGITIPDDFSKNIKTTFFYYSILQSKLVQPPTPPPKFI